MDEIGNQIFRSARTKKYDCEEKVVTEIINLKAILNLPKGTGAFRQ